MKKNDNLLILILFTLLLVFVFIPNVSLAISGACSSHYGVNCSIGPDSDGSVVCNDGWRDSSADYYSAVECTDCSSYLYHIGCKDQSDIDAIRDDFGSRGLFFSGAREVEESYCIAEIQEYENKKLQYQQCLDIQQEALRLKDSYLNEEWRQLEQQINEQVTTICPVNSSYNSSTGRCQCYSGYLVLNGGCVPGDNWCQSNYGVHINYNQQNKTCECVSGYTFKDNRCISLTESCQNKYGINSYSSGNSCLCYSGYEWNVLGTECVKTLVCGDGYIKRDNQCITYTQDCMNTFGSNVIGSKGDIGNSSCNCKSGYEWNLERTACVLTKTSPSPTPTIKETSVMDNVPEDTLIKETEEERVEKTADINTTNTANTVSSVNETEENSKEDEKGFLSRLFQSILSFFRNLKR
jgi:hypothetical protein